ncbi:MAG: hypothetical protein R2847_02045 [Bacteroidia bacterium]
MVASGKNGNADVILQIAPRTQQALCDAERLARLTPIFIRLKKNVE